MIKLFSCIDKLNYKLIVYSVCIMNLFDLVCTYIGLKESYIEEGNDLMAFCYNTNSFYFIFVKSAAIIFFFLILTKFLNRLSFITKTMLLITFSIYVYVMCLHLYGLYVFVM